jgi:hypothetical protein
VERSGPAERSMGKIALSAIALSLVSLVGCCPIGTTPMRSTTFTCVKVDKDGKCALVEARERNTCIK